MTFKPNAKLLRGKLTNMRIHKGLQLQATAKKLEIDVIDLILFEADRHELSDTELKRIAVFLRNLQLK